jgi:hypothetical protein
VQPEGLGKLGGGKKFKLQFIADLPMMGNMNAYIILVWKTST